MKEETDIANLFDEQQQQKVTKHDRDLYLANCM